nr:MAG TPA: protein of unknown function (DUF5053) [Caudoviricetes sp.]
MAKPEYIERDSALRVAHTMRPEDKCLEAAIANIPAADVAPVQGLRAVAKTYASKPRLWQMQTLFGNNEK